jgi:Fe-S-cluster containining protein
MLEFNKTDELFVGDEILREFGSCTDCGLCCSYFSILPIYEAELNEVATLLHLTTEEFEQRYIKKITVTIEQTFYSLKTPCLFLEGNNCRIYEHRFLVCRTFPFFKNLTTNQAILSGIYLCPQATQFYEGLLDFYQKYHQQLYEQLLKKEKQVSIAEDGMKIQGKASLFFPYLDALYNF